MHSPAFASHRIIKWLTPPFVEDGMENAGTR